MEDDSALPATRFGADAGRKIDGHVDDMHRSLERVDGIRAVSDQLNGNLIADRTSVQIQACDFRYTENARLAPDVHC